MTVSTHVYRAYLIGSPDVELSARGGQITLDASAIPHVTADLDIAPPDSATLAALDPRVGARVRVEVSATFPGGTQARVFDLGLRGRSVRHADGVLSLSLASDEALLADYAPLTDDKTPRASETSLRSVVNYVLNKVIPGESLEASPSINANATRYWPITNLIPNPSFEVNAAAWLPGTGASAVARTLMGSPVAVAGSYGGGWTATATGDSNVIPTTGATPNYAVAPGKWYTFSVYICSTVSRTARAVIQWYTAGGAVFSSQVFGGNVTTNNTTFQRITVRAQAPADATHAYPYVSTIGNAIGNAHYVDAAMFYEGDELVPYFDGATTASSTYTYAWSNTAHGSTSTRTPVKEVDKESLTWRAGQAAIDFLAPLVQVAGFRLVCDEGRKWTLRDETYVAGGAISIRHGVNLIDGTDSIDRDTGLWFDAAVTIYKDPITQAQTVDEYALTTPHTRLRTFEKNTPYPGPGFSEYAVRRAQGRGREVSATAVADWRAVAEQPSTFVLEGAPTQIGASNRVEFDLNEDRMTVTSRTTDTPEGAVDLLVGTIDSLVGTIDGL